MIKSLFGMQRDEGVPTQPQQEPAPLSPHDESIVENQQKAEDVEESLQQEEAAFGVPDSPPLTQVVAQEAPVSQAPVMQTQPIQQEVDVATPQPIQQEQQEVNTTPSEVVADPSSGMQGMVSPEEQSLAPEEQVAQESPVEMVTPPETEEVPPAVQEPAEQAAVVPETQEEQQAVPEVAMEEQVVQQDAAVDSTVEVTPAPTSATSGMAGTVGGSAPANKNNN